MYFIWTSSWLPSPISSPRGTLANPIRMSPACGPREEGEEEEEEEEEGSLAKTLAHTCTSKPSSFRYLGRGTIMTQAYGGEVEGSGHELLEVLRLNVELLGAKSM